ncbi:exosome complex component CSL4 [Rhinolophus sinicus]|uniref:exosome complex component CSL4 n=1 Tax=Rhinolophus sinicus TaxID=89399 RepID=UPI003D7906AA
MAPPMRCCIPSKRLCNLEEASRGSSSYTQHGCIGCMMKSSENDKVEIYKSLHPGDVVLAKVISLPDAQSNYLLTTAENELGVVGTHNKSSVQMVPISLCEMQCPKVHTKEFWKVA